VSEVFICCDCTSAIEVIVKRSEPQKRRDVFLWVMELEKLVHDFGVAIKIVWVPGHAGIVGNDRADNLAKATATDVFEGVKAVDSQLSYCSALQLSRKLAVIYRQRYWDRCETGLVTKELIPNVTTKVLFPKERTPGILYCRLMPGDTVLNDDSYRCGLTDSPMCDCTYDRETIEHVLLHCPWLLNGGNYSIVNFVIFGCHHIPLER